MSETKMTSFLNRIKMTQHFENLLLPFLQEHGFVTCTYGYEQILREHPKMQATIKKEKFKKSSAALMVKFSPDVICVYPKFKNSDGLFLLDTKISITPVFYPKHIQRIRKSARLAELRREDIGEIEREAWDVYNCFYPKDKVAIVMASPYHPRLIVAEWVSRIVCMYRLMKDRNIQAGGSGTPHVNIHLGKMRDLQRFLADEFAVKVDSDSYQKILRVIKSWPLSKPAGRVNWKQFNNVINELKVTCPWLKTRWPMLQVPGQTVLVQPT